RDLLSFPTRRSSDLHALLNRSRLSHVFESVRQVPTQDAATIFIEPAGHGHKRRRCSQTEQISNTRDDLGVVVVRGRLSQNRLQRSEEHTSELQSRSD